ncbi:MAG: tripartite tricarboxylate transporter substrate binding protein [Burkholderiales bacterium]|uniref:Bug family tripartite tricarboxylate transporter substrate binding protein n=1 Tax=Ottowia pentelensis TaxID=511108 RepID=A0ABV6PP21_9BURK|nr:tripartite tricarboxylate transporter substrate binding protein [Burkholderiales bacterium]
MKRRDFVAAASAAALPGLSWAQDKYPSKPVRLIVPFPPGGPTDMMGRAAARAMSEQLGQSFVVENRAGAAGNIGTDAAAKAAPDGYLIALSAISSLAIAPHMYSKMPFNVEKDLAPISLVGTTPCAIVANPNAPFSDLKGMIAYAKANPGKISYATSGIGTSNHLAAELLQSVAGFQMTHVPYKGSSQIVPDLISGVVPVSVESSLVTTLQHVKAGKLKAIAVTSAKRASVWPDVPTVAESGYPGFEVESWFGLVASAATPPAIINKLQAAWAAGAVTAETRTAFDNIPANERVTTPAEFGAFIKSEDKRWGELIRKLGIKAD